MNVQTALRFEQTCQERLPRDCLSIAIWRTPPYRPYLYIPLLQRPRFEMAVND